MKKPLTEQQLIYRAGLAAGIGALDELLGKRCKTRHQKDEIRQIATQVYLKLAAKTHRKIVHDATSGF